MDKKYRIEVGVKLTAKKAATYLDDPHINRNLKEKIVKRLSDDILNGKWFSQNGATIVFDWNGKLRDGQHRCRAIVKAQETENLLAKKEKRTPKELSIIVDMVKGINPEAVRTIDIGFKRSLSDTLCMEFRQTGRELKNSQIISIALILVVCNERGNLYGREFLSNDDAWSHFKNHLDLIEFNEKIAGLKFMVPKGYILGLYKIFSMIKSHRELVHPFFEAFSTGENLTKKSPILTLRNKIISIKSAGGSESLGRNAVLCFIVRAWAAYVKGDTLTRLFYTPDNLPQPIKKRKIKAVLANSNY